MPEAKLEEEYYSPYNQWNSKSEIFLSYSLEKECMFWISTVVHREESNQKTEILSGETQWRLTNMTCSLTKTCTEATILELPKFSELDSSVCTQLI